MIKNGQIDINEFNKFIKKGYFTREKHPDADLYIYGYSTGPVAAKNLKWNSATRQMRGLIVDSQGKIIARSFEKFFTFNQYLSEDKVLLSDGQVAVLPKIPYKVFEKLDGSLAILYWIDEKPSIATQRSFTSLKARRATEILYKKYASIFNKLKKDRTYVFEAIYPESKVLIDYGDNEELILLGIIDNETGKDYPLEDIGFPVARDWTNDLINIKSFDDLKSLNLENKEGLVVVYENGFRIKVKFPWYKEAHVLINKMIQYEYYIDVIQKQLKGLLNIPENIPNTYRLWERFQNDESLFEILKDFPNQYKYFGIESWIREEHNKYLKKSNEMNNKFVFPDENKILDIKQIIFNSSSENIMWKRWEQLENMYD
ncbi:RNA ligase [Flavobacterium sp.]|uniref:RNA ligase n=1 Tax=Flavobacterium sp. TaxID=239 RepID=UPI002639C9BB|nr:RNA ligase [Flavobacterium sp.]MDD2984755.1 RNA ligase [Flavobacterium sp.]